MPTDSGLLTVAEAATLANRSLTAIHDWVKRGHLPRTRVRVNYRWVFLFRPEDVARVAAERQQRCVERNHRTVIASGEETMEDVERLIAEQMACLPDWFYKDRERMKNKSISDLLKGDE